MMGYGSGGYGGTFRSMMEPDIPGAGWQMPGSGPGGGLMSGMPQPQGMGGIRPQVPERFGAPTGGYGGAIRDGLGSLSGFEKLYLGANAASGALGWWEQRQQRKEDERRYEEAIQRDDAQRRSMGDTWNRTHGR